MSAALDLDRDAWHAARLRAVGGSEVAALFLERDQLPDYAATRYALWHIKAGNAPAPEVDNERVKWGLRLEEPIARGLAQDNGWTVERGGHVVDPTTQGMACTLDFIVRMPGRPTPGALEIKNVDRIVHKRAWTDGEPPIHIGLQLQHQLACTDYTWGIVAGLVGGNTPALYFYDAKPDLIKEIRRRVREFWQSIADGQEPPVDGSDAAAAVIRALYPDMMDEEVDLTHINGGPEACADFLKAQAARKEADAAYDMARNRVALLLGSSKRGAFTGYSASFSVTAEKPDRVAQPGEIIKGRKESRTYRVKEAA